jgi:hypothetical protein
MSRTHDYLKERGWHTTSATFQDLFAKRVSPCRWSTSAVG